MFRYVNLIILLALSVLFVSAVRAAPAIEEDERVYSVQTVDRGLIPGGRGTMSAPADAEPIITAYKKHLTDTCKESGGKIEIGADFVTAVDVNGDGRADLFMTSQRSFCDGAASYYSGSAGHGSRWAISKADGSYAVGDGLFHKAEIQETLKSGYQVILHLHGTACGKGGVDQCRHVVRFDTKGELISIAWPDGQDRNRDQPKTHQAAIAAPAQADVVNLNDIDGSMGSWDHNGSEMRIPLDGQMIVYVEPKASIRDVVKPGTVVYRGKPFHAGERAEGVAYAFKKGGPPAPYAVRGGYNADRSAIVLRGAGPIRQGCEVVGYSDKSPHAVLRFKSMMSP